MAERFTVTDAFYNTDPTSTVRGVQHVLATVDEDSYDEQDGTPTTTDDHPVMWCQDLEGGRSFYTGLGHNPATFANANVRSNLAGAIKWSAAGLSDPTYSDCGATVLANYKQVKISAPPNLNEPIGFDQLPDGRIIQTARAGQVRLHDPEGGTTTVLTTPSEFPQGVYTHSEDGLYGPAVDANFAQNKWVYLYYSPAVVKDVPQSDGTTRTIRTPTGQAGELPIAAPTTGPDMATWDPYVGYFQLSRFKFVDAAPGRAGAPGHVERAGDHARPRQPRRVLPRRRRHRLRQGRQPVACHGRRHARGRRQLGRLRSVQRHEDERDPDRARDERRRRARSRSRSTARRPRRSRGTRRPPPSSPRSRR